MFWLHGTENTAAAEQQQHAFSASAVFCRVLLGSYHGLPAAAFSLYAQQQQHMSNI
jgi:hypothetical protein